MKLMGLNVILSQSTYNTRYMHISATFSKKKEKRNNPTYSNTRLYFGMPYLRAGIMSSSKCIRYIAIYYNYRMSDVTFDAASMEKL